MSGGGVGGKKGQRAMERGNSKLGPVESLNFTTLRSFPQLR